LSGGDRQAVFRQCMVGLAPLALTLGPARSVTSVQCSAEALSDHRPPSCPREGVMRIGTKRRLCLLARIVLAGTLIGSGYGALLTVAAYATPNLGLPIGAISGFLLSTAIGAVEIFGTRSRHGRVVEQAPFLVTLLVKGLVYGSMIAFVNIFDPGARLLRV